MTKLHAGSIKALLLLSFAIPAYGADDVLKRADVIKSVEQLKKDAFGPLHYEVVLEVTPISTEFIGGSGLDVQLPPVPKDLQAIIHCHPDIAYPRPSVQDGITAQALHVPVYTISRKAVWVSLPNGTARPVTE